jgi:peptidoglycan/LPS O-acetylase OafA/YrhL
MIVHTGVIGCGVHHRHPPHPEVLRMNIAIQSLPEVDAPTASPRPARSTRYYSLDMWRGIACLAIVVCHAGIYTYVRETASPTTDSWLYRALLEVSYYAYLGVPLFFMISGYCITATIESTHRKDGSRLEYFKRRIRRIYPPYWITLLISLGLFLGLEQFGCAYIFANQNDELIAPWSFSIPEWLGNLTLTDSWRHHFFGEHHDMIVPQAWSLCFEEQFYIVCGLLLLLAPRFYYHGILGITFVVASLAALRFLGLAPAVTGSFLDPQWFFFALGVLVFYAINHAGPKQYRTIIIFLVCFALTALHPYYWVAHKRYAPELLASSLFALALLLLHPFDRQLARTRLLAPLFFCGEMCYSMYLVHIWVAYPIRRGMDAAGLGSVGNTLFVTIPLSVLLSVVVARVFFVFVERRFLNPPVANTTPGSIVRVCAQT